MIRSLAASLTFLLAFGVAAQAVSPVEQSYGPYTRPYEGYEPALAVSHDSILLAWSEVLAPGTHPKIRIGVLDFHGRLVSPITTLQTSGHAVLPTVTSDGSSFRLGYLEDRIPFGVNVDARGALVGSPRPGPFPTPSPLTARWFSPAWGCWGCYRSDWMLNWTFLGKSGSHLHREQEIPGSVAAGGSPNHFMLAWNAPSGVTYIEYVHGVKQVAEGTLIPVSVHEWEQPAIACDDTHCLLAFTTPSRQIYGVLVDSTQPHLATPVPIETASRVERPQVHLLQNGRFLVAYMSAENDPRYRFANRIVTTAPQPRRRAVR